MLQRNDEDGRRKLSLVLVRKGGPHSGSRSAEEGIDPAVELPLYRYFVPLHPYECRNNDLK